MENLSAQQHLLPPVIFLAMLAVGMELRLGHFRELFQAPKVPIVGTLIHSLTFPLLAVSGVVIVQLLGFSLAEATVIGVLLIAACPSGGFSNILTMMAKANLPLSVVLTAVSSILSFVSVPVLMSSFGLLVTELQGPVSLPVAQTLIQLLILILIPVIGGMLMAEKLTWLSDERIAKLQARSQLLLYIVVAMIIAENWTLMVAGFWAALPWSAGLCIGNIGCCFLLSRFAGLKTEDAITVALEGSIRNVGVAFLIAANSLDRMDIAVLPTVYFLSVLVFSILFAKNWRRLPGFTP